jgi:outer membrane protein OmpA-like peptidoglycan-associated protein
MAPTTKFLIGLSATALLAWLFHGPIGNGRRFMDQLEQSTATAISGVTGASGVSATFEREGSLHRVAVLSGPNMSPLERDRIRAEVIAATPGLFDARWADDVAAKAVIIADTGKPATVEQVKTCQAEVDGAIKGKMVNFSSGGSALTADSLPLLDAIAVALGPCQGTRVEIAGHTDAAGGTARNMRLSEERANAVVQGLVDRGIPALRLLPRGYGEAKPLDLGASVDAYAKNRRIEFSVSAAAK